jgi:hypothetical protein
MDTFESVLTQWLLTGEDSWIDKILEVYPPEVPIHQLPRALCEGMGSTEASCNSNMAIQDAFKALLKAVQVIPTF